MIAIQSLRDKTTNILSDITRFKTGSNFEHFEPTAISREGERSISDLSVVFFYQVEYFPFQTLPMAKTIPKQAILDDMAYGRG